MEATELRDGGTRFGGFGVLGAVDAVNGELRERARRQDAAGPAGAGLRADRHRRHRAEVPARRQRDPRRLARGRAGRAGAAGVPLYSALNANAHVLPAPLVNLINGGKHASNDLDFQEFIVIPVGAESILEALQISTEVNLALAEILLERYGKSALNTGDEGGYAPAISDPHEALGLLHEAVANAGHQGRFRYGLDAAATHYYDVDSGTYDIAGSKRDRDGMIELYQELIREFDIVTIEDPLDENDFEGFAELTEASGIQIVGDDLFVTNPERLRIGLEAGAANSLLWKVNQIGTLSEALDAADIAHRARLHRRRLGALGRDRGPDHRRPGRRPGAGQIKTGAPVRGERTAKYNRLIRIEEELGATASYPGDVFPAAIAA